MRQADARGLAGMKKYPKYPFLGGWFPNFGREADADALALDLLTDFERRFGDFVTAIGG